MVAIINPRRVSQDILQPVSNLVSSSSSSAIQAKEHSPRNYYKIRYVYPGETTLLFFASHISTRERVAIKILKEYHDTRYQMASIRERQQCQIEAIKQNRRFTPEVYIGLARLHYLDLDKKEVCLGEIIKEPDSHKLDENAEYVLVMQWLPKSKRLDYLLDTNDTSTLEQYMKLLSEVIAKMYDEDIQSKENDSGNTEWGSYKQLKQKLQHNFDFFDLVLEEAQKASKDTYLKVEKALPRIKKILSEVFNQSQFRCYFEQRLHEQRVFHCHGDLKAANIWILSPEQCHHQSNLKRVKILDAIDFNPTYCNVDVLSDMAMLAADIEARTSHRIAQVFIRNYLKITKQQNKTAKAVLAYYLVERAMIGAIVCIGYDALPETGLQYLRVAERYISELQRRESVMWFDSIAIDILKLKNHFLQHITALKNRKKSAPIQENIVLS
jgi:aminoglycoside phosphotransferase family enzyme